MIRKQRGIIILSIFFLAVFFIYFIVQEAKQEDLLLIHEDVLQQNKKLSEIVASQEEKIKELEKGFSYVEALTEEERADYEAFLDTKMSDNLIFSPEKTLLVYLHAVSNGDIEAIHALTHTSENLTEFSERYQGSEQSYQDMESVMTYRYYDWVNILEGESTDEPDVNVEISISQSGNTWVGVYNLVKDGKNWKLNFD